ncbi:MAG: sulfatase-like hydrolase/transferase [Deltaproteobacteria bacterium]|nr:sulfatase-like hydrolase/transferase [Deltaproteobacteria bacterium]
MHATSATSATPSLGGAQPASSRIAALRRRARWRRRLAAATLALPVALVWLLDVWTRPTRIAHFRSLEAGTYLLSSIETLILWASLIVLASRSRGLLRWLAALVAILLSIFLLGGQRYFFDQYVTYLNADAASFGASVGRSVVNQVAADASNFARFVVPPSLVIVALLVAGRRLIRPTRTQRRIATLVAPVAIVVTLWAPCSFRKAQASTPDVIFMHALGRVVAARTGLSSEQWVSPSTRKPDYLPALVASPSRPRNVLLVLSESERFDSVCTAYDPECKLTPHSNAASPARTPLLALRSVSSTTAISEIVLWSGTSPVDSAEAVRSSPMLWDYAHAAGWETSYTTSQNLDFADARTFLKELPLKHRADALDLDPASDLDIGAPDEMATSEGLKHIADLREPFFAVVHYSNTHFPYRVDLKHAPFQPCDDTKDPDRTSEFVNYYRNSIYLSDMATADLIKGVRALPAGPRTVILFTSDHAEAFREHGQLGHTNSVLDEEIHVPGWVDAPPGTLTNAERAALEQASRAYTTHLDFAPTMLDLMGLWDAPETGRHRARMLGQSMLRPMQERAVPLTNCAAVWGCPFRNWGMLRGRMKLEARQWDLSWHCYDVQADPHEWKDLGPDACGDLPASAMKLFGKLPRD